MNRGHYSGLHRRTYALRRKGAATGLIIKWLKGTQQYKAQLRGVRLAPKIMGNLKAGLVFRPDEANAYREADGTFMVAVKGHWEDDPRYERPSSHSDRYRTLRRSLR